MKRWLPVVPLLLFVTPAFADVIFPAFVGPYVMAAIFPFSIAGILLIESATFKVLADLSWVAATLIAVAANGTSSAVGVLIGSLLPSGLIDGPNGVVVGGAEFMLYFWLGFVLAYCLSVLIETGILKLAARKLTLVRCFKVTAIANALSYLMLAGIVVAQR